MKNKAWLILCVISFAAALALALTNLVTEGPIAEQSALAATQSRLAAMPGADSFSALELKGDTMLQGLYAANKGGKPFGYVGQGTAIGYGGPIEVMLGVDEGGTIVGISVGGQDFAETAGLGSRTRDPEFTDQFIGLTSAPELGENIDAISGATISSTAVVEAARHIYNYAMGIDDDI